MLQPPVVLHSGAGEQQLNGFRRKLQPGGRTSIYFSKIGVKKDFSEALEHAVCGTWRNQVEVGAAVWTKNLDTSQ